jgi:hypothetical protein
MTWTRISGSLGHLTGEIFLIADYNYPPTTLSPASHFNMSGDVGMGVLDSMTEYLRLSNP